MTDDSLLGEPSGGPDTTSQPADDATDADSGGGSRLVSRRTLLAGAGGLVAGGATFAVMNVETIRAFFAPTHESAGEAAWLAREEETTETTEAVTGTVQLDGGQYTAQRLWARSAGATLSWRIERLDGGTVDVWVLPEGQLDRYRDDEEPRFNADLSAERIETATGLTGDVPDGDWWVVLDNTPLFGSDADDSIELDIELRIAA